MGLSQKEADQLDTYICPNCQRKDSADPTNLKELTDDDYVLLHRLMKSLLVGSDYFESKIYLCVSVNQLCRSSRKVVFGDSVQV